MNCEFVDKSMWINSDYVITLEKAQFVDVADESDQICIL